MDVVHKRKNIFVDIIYKRIDILLQQLLKGHKVDCRSLHIYIQTHMDEYSL